MGLRNCCCSREEKDDLVDNFFANLNKELLTSKKINLVFKIESEAKIKNCDFAESHKTKRYKLKNRKRILVVDENNVVSVLSFYLGNLIFVLSAFKVSEKYKILDCSFLSKDDSTRFCLILEEKSGKVEVLVIKLKKAEDLPNIELNMNEKDQGEEMQSMQTIQTMQTMNQTNQTNQTNHHSTSSTLNERNKKAVESIINSSDSESWELNSVEDKGKFNENEVIVLCNYDSNTSQYYFKPLTKKQAKKLYSNAIMVKYGYYSCVIKLIINEEEEFYRDISQTKIENNYIYLFSDHNSKIKCLKINKSSRTYETIFTSNLSFKDPFTDLIFPICKDNIFVIDGLDFINYQNGKEVFKTPFKKFFSAREDDIISRVEFIKFTQVIYNSTNSKLKKGFQMEFQNLEKNTFNNSIVNFFLSGLCNLNRKPFEEPQQLIATIQIDLSKLTIETDIAPEKIEIAPTKSKIKFLQNIPYISELSYGPFNNGPYITGHINGTISLWNMYDLSITKVIKLFDMDVLVNKILIEPMGLTLCCSEKNISSLHLIEKKYEYFYNENEHNELERVIRINN